MTLCALPYPSNPDIRCSLEAGHKGDHTLPSLGNATAIRWPVESWPRWRSVKDEPPQTRTTVLVLWHDVIQIWDAMDLWNHPSGVTHWMPLPPPPEGSR